MSGLFSGYRRLDSPEAAAPMAVTAAPAANVPALIRPAKPAQTEGVVDAVTQELKRLLEERTRQWHTEAARAQRVFGVLVELAGELCREAFDAELKRAGDLLLGTPDELKEFIGAQLRPILSAQALAASDFQLALHYQTLQDDYRQIREINGRLRVIVKQTEREVNSLRLEVDRLETLRGQQPVKPGASAPPALLALPAPPAPAAMEEALARVETEAPVDHGRVDDLVRLMAATGLARFSKIRERLTTAWGLDIKSGSMRAVLDEAVQAGFIKLFEAKADWQGAAKSLFVELTTAGLARARVLGVEAAPSEITEGVRRGYKLEHLSLILRSAEILNEEGYQAVRLFPDRVMLPERQEYQPVLTAVSREGKRLYVECEREKAEEAPREKRWQLAALAGGGEVWLMTTTAAMQETLISEIKLTPLPKPFSLAAANISDFARKVRGRNGSMWTYRQ